jgi:type IV pilus assembly protein PilF
MTFIHLYRDLVDGGALPLRRCARWRLLILTWVVFSVLAGCAGSSEVRTSTSAEPFTESDEPEAFKRARIRLELATGYFEQGQTSVALDEIKQALAANPSFGPAYVLRGLVYMRLNEPGQAEDSFRRALQINGKDPDALHNYGWFVCQRGRYAEAKQFFDRALGSPAYSGQAKTLMAKGVCQIRMGDVVDAERTLSRSYELDAANPITGYNLALLVFQRKDYSRAQFYIRRLNNSELANAESLWLGIKVERSLNNMPAVEQLGQQLLRRFPTSPELAAYQRGAFHE